MDNHDVDLIVSGDHSRWVLGGGERRVAKIAQAWARVLNRRENLGNNYRAGDYVCFIISTALGGSDRT